MKRISQLVVGLLFVTTFAHAQVIGGTDSTTRDTVIDQQGTVIPAGLDHFETPGATLDFHLDPIPADFFGPGCLPFSGELQLSGVPLDPPNLGTTDTIVERLGEANLPDPLPSSDTIPIEIVELSLRSVAPITVQCGTDTQQWDVELELSPTLPSPGQMTIEKAHSDGGTFSAEFNVQPLFIFTRQSDGAVQTVEPVRPFQFSGSDIPWDFPPCHGDILIPGNFCPSADGSGPIVSPLLQQPFDLLNGQWNIRPATALPDSDSDGVADDVDLCPDTAIPEQTVPTVRLLPNHYALIDPDLIFEVGGRRRMEPIDSPFTLSDTGGCSCEQILASIPGKQRGQQMFGCSDDTLEDWIEDVVGGEVEDDDD